MIILAYIFIKGFNLPQKIYKNMYPKQYEEYVLKYADEYQIDPLLVFAMIKAESNFNKDAVSKSNAVGLMQLMDTTAEELANKLNIEYTKNVLLDPETNIKLGTKYYQELYERYGNEVLALAAYNAGRGKVNEWISKGILKEDGSNAEDIPYRETNNYVRKILRDYEIYKELYEN